MFGSLTSDEVLTIATELLSLIPADAEPRLESGGSIAVYSLLDDPTYGTVNLKQRRSLDAVDKMPNEFVIEAELKTQPGHYTGSAEDCAEKVNMTVGFGFDAADAPKHVTFQAFNQTHSTEQFARYVETLGTVPIGGNLSVRPEGAVWRPLSLRVFRGDAPGKMQWVNTQEEDVPVAGSLDDARVPTIAATLKSTRNKGKP